MHVSASACFCMYFRFCPDWITFFFLQKYTKIRPSSIFFCISKIYPKWQCGFTPPFFALQGKVLGDRLSMFLHMYTMYSSLRPFGCSVLLASYADDGPQLYMIDPSGSAWVRLRTCTFVSKCGKCFFEQVWKTARGWAPHKNRKSVWPLNRWNCVQFRIFVVPHSLKMIGMIMFAFSLFPLW